MKKEKGITLIALIITIIVMLILIAVTINVALNGGIFEKAKDASKQTEEKAILEKIIAMATWNDDGTIDVENTITDVEKEFNSVTNNSDGTYTIKGKTGEYKYQITKDKIAIESKNNGGGEHEPNQYGFYEDVVYEYSIEENGHTLNCYMYFESNNSTLKGRILIDGSVVSNVTQPYPEIKNNPTYEVGDTTQQIQGTIMEYNNRPGFRVENNGSLTVITCEENEGKITSIDILNDKVYIPNFELDPDMIFTE